MRSIGKVRCWMGVTRGVLIPSAMAVLTVGCGNGTPVEGPGEVEQLGARMPRIGPGFAVMPTPSETLPKIVGLVGHIAGAEQSEEMLTGVLAVMGIEVPPGASGDVDTALEAYGIDGGRPLGLAMSEHRYKGITYFPLESEAKFVNAFTTKDSIRLPLDVAGKAVLAGADRGLRWFVADGYAVMARNESTLRAAAEAFGAPVENSAPVAKLLKASDSDLIQVMRMDGVMADEYSGHSAALSLLGEWYDTIVVEVNLAPGKESHTARLMAHKRSPSKVIAGPLVLHQAMGPDTLLNLSLQEGSGLVSLLNAAASDGLLPLPVDNTQLEAVLTPLLKNRLALSVDVPTNGMPGAQLTLQPMLPEMVDLLLGLGGLHGVAAEAHGSVPMYTVDNVPPAYGAITYAFQDDTFVVSNSDGGTRDALDNLAVNVEPADDAPNRADLTVDLGKGVSSPILKALTGFNVATDAAEIVPLTLQAWDRSDVLEVKISAGIPALNLFAGRTTYARSAARSSSSQNNQKQLGLVFKMYAHESQGRHFPPLNESPGHLVFAAREAEDYRNGHGTPVFPEYLSDVSILVNPGAVDSNEWRNRAENDPLSAVDDYHYIYWGYLVRDDAEMTAYAEAYLTSVAGGAVPNTDMEFQGETIYRLREGVERFALEDLSSPAAAAQFQSAVPVLVERRGAWPNDVINVLFMDGHVETVAPGQFPNTDAFWENVARLNAVKKE